MSMPNTKIKPTSFKKKCIIATVSFASSFAMVISVGDLGKTIYNLHEKSQEVQAQSDMMKAQEAHNQALLSNISDIKREAFIIDAIKVVFDNHAHYDKNAWIQKNFTDYIYHERFENVKDIHNQYFQDLNKLKAYKIEMSLASNTNFNSMSLIKVSKSSDVAFYEYTVPIIINYETPNGKVIATDTQNINIQIEQYKDNPYKISYMTFPNLRPDELIGSLHTH